MTTPQDRRDAKLRARYQRPENPCTEAEFLRCVQKHKMFVVQDDGVNRHLMFKGLTKEAEDDKPAEYTFNQWFEIITWPGKLWEDVVQPIAWEPTEPGLNVMATSLVAGHFVDKHPESGWVLYSRGEGSRWEQRTARAFAPSKQHLPVKEGGIWRWKFIEED